MPASGAGEVTGASGFGLPGLLAGASGVGDSVAAAVVPAGTLTAMAAKRETRRIVSCMFMDLVESGVD